MSETNLNELSTSISASVTEIQEQDFTNEQIDNLVLDSLDEGYNTLGEIKAYVDVNDLQLEKSIERLTRTFGLRELVGINGELISYYLVKI